MFPDPEEDDEFTLRAKFAGIFVKMNYWVRVIYVSPDKPNEVAVREFERASDASMSDHVLTIKQGDGGLVLNCAPSEPLACRLISLEKEPNIHRVNGWSNLADECYKLAKSGKKIGAIKRCREETGMALKEAKAWVEDVVANWNNKANEDDDIPF